MKDVNPFVILLAALAIIALVTAMFMFGWNGFMVPIIGLPQVNYLNSFSALLIFAIVGSCFKGGKKDD